MDKKMYDTIEGIRKTLTIFGFEGLHQIIAARRKTSAKNFSAEKKELKKLNEFVLLGGRIILDLNGNFFRRIGKDVFLEEYLAIDYEEFRRHNSGKDVFWEIFNIPPADVVCPECGLDFGLQDCVEAITMTNNCQSLKDFSGKKIFEVRKIFARKTDGEYRLEDCPGENRIVNEGEAVFFTKLEYRHLECHKKFLERSTMTPFENAFKEAGFENPKLFPVKNEYSPSLLSAPWFAVPWYSHRFKVGWQHRVIHLEIDILLSELEKESGSEYLSRLKSKLPNLEELFKEEKVTKGRRFIHAYGYEELIRYLKVILSALH